jgi:thiol-disulfide isomerase/thioredoxin
MRRWLPGLLVLALACVAVRADEEKGAKKSEGDKAPKEAVSFKKLQMEMIARLNEARIKKDQKAFNEVLKKYGPQMAEFVEKNPKSPEAPAARNLLQQIMQALVMTGDETGFKLAKTALKATPDMKAQARLVKALVQAGERQPKFKKETEEYKKLLTTKYAAYFIDLSIGKVLPNFISQDLEGQKVELKSLRGKVVVLDVWATWCGPCRAMIPHERELVGRLKDKPFVLVSISIDAKKDTLTNFLKKEKMPWTHWWNGASGGIVADWEINAIPTIFVLDGKGVIRYKNVRGPAMDKAVEALLKEMEDAKKSS